MEASKYSGCLLDIDGAGNIDENVHQHRVAGEEEERNCKVLGHVLRVGLGVDQGGLTNDQGLPCPESS